MARRVALTSVQPTGVGDAIGLTEGQQRFADKIHELEQRYSIEEVGKTMKAKKRPPVSRKKKKAKRQPRPIGVKEYVTLNSFMRKLPVEHRRYRLPITRGMTMTSYLNRLGKKLGWTRVRLDHLLWS